MNLVKVVSEWGQQVVDSALEVCLMFIMDRQFKETYFRARVGWNSCLIHSEPWVHNKKGKKRQRNKEKQKPSF